MTTKDPQYCRQVRPGKPDLAFVEFKNGPRVYLGTYDSEESRHKYHRVLAEWHATGHAETRSPSDLTVTELVERFWHFAQATYLPPSKECDSFRAPLKLLRDFYGRELAAEFSPRDLKALLRHMIDAGLAQKTINRRLGIFKKVFKWAVSEELVPVAVHQALATVEGLRRGRSTAPPPVHVLPVLKAHIDAVEPHVSRQVWALVQLQLLTGARPGELLALKPCDIDRTGKIWTSRPEHHKTAYHGHSRVIYFGPRAQEVLAPFLEGRTPWTPLFSPQEAEEERRRALHAARLTPLSCGNRPGTNRVRKPKRTAGEHYTVDSYRRAIVRACEPAKVPAWHPHQLRHNAATFLRKEFGLDGARVILGHRSPAITDLYAELDREKALDIMAQYG